MIIVNLNGGLGNQIFQVFNGMSYGKKHGQKIYFMKDKTCKRTVYWDNIFFHLKKKVKNIKLQPYREPFFHYREIPKLENRKFMGYFQSEKYFKNDYELIYQRLGIKEIREKYQNDYNFKNSCSLHFRLGDYKKEKCYLILTNKYYQNAINQLKNVDKIYVFFEKKERPTVIKRLSKLKFSGKFILIDEKYQDFEQLLLISLCKNNICANSTFSWWGAYLNSNVNKQVYCPKEYFTGSKKDFKMKDFWPGGWIKI